MHKIYEEKKSSLNVNRRKTEIRSVSYTLFYKFGFLYIRNAIVYRKSAKKIGFEVLVSLFLEFLV